MTNISERSEVTNKVRKYIELKVNPTEFTGVQLKELENTLISMAVQRVNATYAEGFLKATGADTSFADHYKAFVTFDPEEEEAKIANELAENDIGRLMPKMDKTSEAKAKGAKTAFDFIARELGIFSPESSAEEQLNNIVNKIKELKEAKISGSIDFARALYKSCYQRNADNMGVGDIVKEIKNSVKRAEEFSSFKIKLSDLFDLYK